MDVFQQPVPYLDPPCPFRYYATMEKTRYPETWAQLFREIAASPGVVFLLGAPDTGKSTLARFLCSQSIQGGFRTAYIDGDLGQSVIGPPATIGMALPRRDIQDLGWDYLYFIGATSPANHLLATAAGVGRLTHKALACGAQVAVVDTSGLVAGEMGFALKFYKIELLQPRHICAIQRGTEVEHILKGFRDRRGIRMHMLAPPQGVCTRTPEVRRTYRQTRFEAYFQGCRSRTIPLDEVELIYPEYPLLTAEGAGERLQGTLVGLIDDEYFTKGLGIWEGFDCKRTEVSLTTPLDDFRDIRYLHVGHITLQINR